jgi:hypothetical protein
VTSTAHVRFDPESLLRSLMENVPGAVYRCEVDADWTMVGIGDDIERITGYPAADFIASARRSFSSIIHPDDRERVHEERGVAIAAGISGPVHVRVEDALQGREVVVDSPPDRPTNQRAQQCRCAVHLEGSFELDARLPVLSRDAVPVAEGRGTRGGADAELDRVLAREDDERVPGCAARQVTFHRVGRSHLAPGAAGVSYGLHR